MHFKNPMGEINLKEFLEDSLRIFACHLEWSFWLALAPHTSSDCRTEINDGTTPVRMFSSSCKWHINQNLAAKEMYTI
jgi:hypothetical protein